MKPLSSVFNYMSSVVRYAESDDDQLLSWALQAWNLLNYPTLQKVKDFDIVEVNNYKANLPATKDKIIGIEVANDLNQIMYDYSRSTYFTGNNLLEFTKDTTLMPSDIVKEPEILEFFMKDIDSLLNAYKEGKTEFKPDVTKQLTEIKEKRETMIKEHIQKQADYNDTVNKINMMMNPQSSQNTINQQSIIIQQLTTENEQMKIQIAYLENKLKQLINEKVQEKMKEKRIQLSSSEPTISINTL